jgi:hypothetical protein
MSPSKNAGAAESNRRRRLWEEFRTDNQTLAILRVTPDEVNRLHTVFMISAITERGQLISALHRMRLGRRQ